MTVEIQKMPVQQQPVSIGPEAGALKFDDFLKKSNPLNAVNSLEELLKNRVKFVPAKLSEVDQEIPYQAINVGLKKPFVPVAVPSATGGVSPVASTSKLPSLKGKEKGTASDDFEISPDWPRNYGAAVSGLQNMGNTCYLNATLQALTNTPPLVHALLASNAHSAENCRLRAQRKFCALCELHALMTRAFERKSRGGGPSNIVNSLKRFASHFRPGRQEDAHEFLRFFMDAMQTSCLAAYGPNQLKAKPELKTNTLIHRIFGGRFRSRVQCSKCNYKSDTFDTMLDLSLDVTNCSHLKDALDRFVRPDYLRGNNKYKCERCKKLVDASKGLTVDKAPNVLTVHMKRFTPTGRKITNQVQFDEFLNLGPVMSEDENPRYRLDGIVSHSGSGPHSGHYYSHCRSSDNQWYRFDDSSVTRQGNTRQLLGLKTAYILVYTRIDNTSPSSPQTGMKRKHVEEIDEDVGESVSSKPFIGPQRPRSPSPKENPFSMKKSSPILPSPRPSQPLGERKSNNFHEKHASAAAPVTFYGNDSPNGKKPRRIHQMKGKHQNNPNYPNKKSKHPGGYQPKVIKDRRR